MAANKVHWWDAPKGYKAVLANPKHCDGCVFQEEAFDVCESFSCLSIQRKDANTVIFVKRQEKIK